MGSDDLTTMSVLELCERYASLDDSTDSLEVCAQLAIEIVAELERRMKPPEDHIIDDDGVVLFVETDTGTRDGQRIFVCKAAERAGKEKETGA